MNYACIDHIKLDIILIWFKLNYHLQITFLKTKYTYELSMELRCVNEPWWLRSIVEIGFIWLKKCYWILKLESIRLKKFIQSGSRKLSSHAWKSVVETRFTQLKMVIQGGSTKWEFTQSKKCYWKWDPHG